jgi:hypothetical protein
LVGAIFLGLVSVGIIFAGCALGIPPVLEWLDGRVVPVDGLLKRVLSMTSNNNSASYYYAHEKFGYKVSKEAYKALVPGLRYRVYHTPCQHRLMSREPLDETLLQ